MPPARHTTRGHSAPGSFLIVDEVALMQHRWIPLALAALVAQLGSGLTLAADKALAPQAVASSSKPPRPATAKLVDINSASRAELKTLPGIGDAEAARIIAARPYLSKANLVVHKVLSIEAYDALKGRIVAVQKPALKSKP